MVISAAEEISHLKEDVEQRNFVVDHARTDLHGLEMALTDANAANLDLDNHHR